MLIPSWAAARCRFEDCVSEEFYEKEREHVFKKTWLYVGRVERVPKSGSYFTRELKFLNTSIIIVRGKDDVIRAFHNICPHRGNKLLWQDDPFEEVAGPGAPALLPLPRLALQPRRLAALAPTRKDLLLDFDADSCRVPAIQCEVWEGFIFINLNPHNTEPLRSFLGELAHGIEGYPVRRATPGLSVQGRAAVQLEDLRRQFRGELPRPVSACLLVRKPHRGGQRGSGQTEPVHRCVGATSSRVRTGCSPSPVSRRERPRIPSPSNA